MTTVRVADDGGDEMILFNYNGFNYPDFPSKSIVNLSSVKIRSDDVIVAAYPKSGTHWVHEITRFLLAGKLDDSDIAKGATMMELVEENAYADLPSPRLINSHVRFNSLPEEVKLKKPKIVYITRNPKDVAVSYYEYMRQVPVFEYTGKWENWLKPAFEGKFDYGSWFDYVKEWEAVKKTTDVPIITVNYEDLQEDPVREVKRLREFLGIERSDEFLKQVCDKCSFNSLKKYKTTSSSQFLSAITYRKGIVGDWKNWFTVAQNDWFDKVYQEKMKDCPLEFRYTLD